MNAYLLELLMNLFHLCFNQCNASLHFGSSKHSCFSKSEATSSIFLQRFFGQLFQWQTKGLFLFWGLWRFFTHRVFSYLDMWHLSVSAWFSCTHHRHSARQLGVNMANSPVEMATSGFYPYFLHSGMSFFSHVLIGARPAT